MPSTPAIRVLCSDHCPPAAAAAAAASSAPASLPMSIPQSHAVPPPPLPPPRYVDTTPGLDLGWQFGNHDIDCARPASVKPGSSLLGGLTQRGPRHEKEHDGVPFVVDRSRRGSSISTITTTATTRDQDMTDDGAMFSNSDEDGSVSRPPSNYRLHSERQLEQRTLEESSNSYDKHLLSRIGGPNGPNTPKRQSISFAPPGSLQECSHAATQAEGERRHGSLRPLALPERHQAAPVGESPATSRWPQSGAMSPGLAGHWSDLGAGENGQAPTRHGSLTFEDSISHRGSYDQSAFASDEFMDDAHMTSLHLHDHSPGSDDYAAKTGTKRRASSPPREGAREDVSSVSSASGPSESYPRRPMQHFPNNRSSPVSRFHTSHSSLSSASSFAPRHGSLGSSLGIASVPSSATSYGSGRLSPSAPSPAVDADGRLGMPYGSSASARLVSHSPAASSPHHRTLSESTQAGTPTAAILPSVAHSRSGSMSAHLPRIYICECCPKKPKKFDSEGELRLHESEKQYTCAYCPNRFKNKNEAERHQNSLHLRRHSWSCAALAGVEAVYHASLSGNGTDACGYCGEEFPNPPQWDARAEHLSLVHKFGECNQAKKFFRADHFRQHLKHSHAGTSGKWTNMLENACMKDEPLPEKRASPGGGLAGRVVGEENTA